MDAQNYKKPPKHSSPAKTSREHHSRKDSTMKADNLSDEEIKTYLNIERIPSPCKAAKSHRSVADNRGNKDKEQFIPQKVDFIKIA